MALQKTPIEINFSQGLDTKTDDKQVDIGKFLTLNNMVFDTSKRLTKRNGFANITNLPDYSNTTLTTINDNLLVIGSNLSSYSQDTNQWINKGSIQPVGLDTLSLVRSSTSQSSADSAVYSNGLTCTTYVDGGLCYYQISDSNTGEQIISRTPITNSVASPRVFILNKYFIVTFISTISAATHLQYIAIPIVNPGSPANIANISSSLVDATAGYDGYVANNNLYLGWSDSGTTVKLAKITSSLILSSATVIAAQQADLVSMTADISGPTPVIWITWDDAGDGFVAAFNQNLSSTPILTPTVLYTTTAVNEITSVATAGVLTVIYENDNDYGSPYPVGSVKTDYISKNTVTQAGVVGSPSVILRSVGLASKAFFNYDNTIYCLVTYGETNQPTYFLIDSLGHIYMRLAYSNGGGYQASQVLPSVSVIDDSYYYVPYLIKDLLATTNKGTNLPANTPKNAIYTQTGINLAIFTINSSAQYSSEIARTLHLTGGQLWMYDSVRPVEHGFQVWPENIAGSTSTGAGGLVAQTYNYIFTYEWTDNEGNLHRSAPSIPFTQATTTSSSTNTLYVPTLRLTYKVSPNPVRIVGYRWSTAQQTYYQFTSITSPVVNSTTVDYIAISDANADSAILGQTLLYTTGGVVENIAAPASTDSALFKNRLFLIDAEDQNLLWYSKQVIQGVPVEMSDLLTIYVAPTSGTQGSTGPMTAISAMDDKFIIFKRDAIYYITGTGPDNTGANNDFSDPVFITSSVGCTNPNSIVLMQNGIMFQSDKGIWLLGRDLSTVYIGAPAEAFNSQIVQSATAIPGTNQIRFILSNNITLMYDYFFNQWGTFSNLRAISATLYQGYHTYLNSFGQVFQETPGMFLDGSKPVLISFKTSWINIAGLQGYERFYFMYLLGSYLTPFKLDVQIYYDYDPNAFQSVIVTPDNDNQPYGDEALWGTGDVWGGPSSVFEARVFPETQKCSSFQISISENYDSMHGIPAGQGLTLSGLNLVVGVKKGYRTQKASRSFG